MDWETFRTAAVAFSWRQVAFFIAQLLFVYLGVPLLLTTSKETPVPYTVPVPEQSKEGWKGELFENPSIKVPHRSKYYLEVLAHYLGTDLWQ